MRTGVLVVGGGVVGLTSALFLAQHGVPCVLVERHPDLLIHPRSRGLTPRTMEVYRQAGLEPAILAAAYGGAGFGWAPVQANTLNDEVYAIPDEPAEDDGAAASPCGFGPVDQDKLEVLVRARARELGADLRFFAEMTSFTQNADGVTAAVTDRGSGASETIEADYLVAADGADSQVRHALGIEVGGPGPMFTTLTAIVDADLTPALRGRAVTIAYLQQPRPFTILMAHDDAGQRWVFGTGYDPDREPLASYTDDRVVDMVRAAAGLAEVEVRLRPQVPGTDVKVLSFPIGAHVAGSYRSGRVFLAGDAAHICPPTGGLGANAGIQDAHNLAWKLGLVLSGRAGGALLDTYDAERRCVGMLTMGQALARFGSRMGPAAGPAIIDYGAVAMGYRYPTARSGGEPAGQQSSTEPVLPARLSGQPGTRAPHVPVPGDAARSVLDLFGDTFVLLTGPARRPWLDALATLAGQDALPVPGHQVGADVCAAYGISDAGASLVRPDGFVGWRSQAGAADPAAILSDAIRAALCW